MTRQRVVSLAGALLKRGGTFESAGGGTAIDQATLKQALLDRLTAPVSEDQQALAPELAELTADQIIRRSAEALDLVDAGTSANNLSDAQATSLEAIVLLTGRPALRYPKGKLEKPEPIGENAIWQVLVAMEHKQIESRSASVGRIALEPAGSAAEPVGTGWRLGTNLIVTNRHVACRLIGLEIPPQAAPADSWSKKLSLPCVIDFAMVNQPPAPRRFRLAKVAWCAGRNGPDLAILELKTSGAEAVPDPLPLNWEAAALGQGGGGTNPPDFQGRKIYVVGHPYSEGDSTAVAEVFGRADGRKRFSPGYVTRIRPTGIFDHDCSTLGGNSGSCVMSAETHDVVGIHFAGVSVDEEEVGTSNVALALARMSSARAKQILSRGQV